MKERMSMKMQCKLPEHLNLAQLNWQFTIVSSIKLTTEGLKTTN
jgi:hypothetical protein